MPDYEILLLGPDAMGDVAALEALCFSSPWGEEQLRKAVSSPHFTVYGLKRQDDLVAYISLALVPGEAEVLNLATHPDCRRQGWGRKLFLGAIADIVQRSAVAGREHGLLPVERAFLEVRLGNMPARRLYDSLGFSVKGRRKAYYQDNGEDALIMSLDLGENWG